MTYWKLEKLKFILALVERAMDEIWIVKIRARQTSRQINKVYNRKHLKKSYYISFQIIFKTHSFDS